MEYKHCNHKHHHRPKCDVCEKTFEVCDYCLSVNKYWCICKTCELICSTCGEKNFEKFGYFNSQACFANNRCYYLNIFCKKCATGRISQYCKDCENT